MELPLCCQQLSGWVLWNWTRGSKSPGTVDGAGPKSSEFQLTKWMPDSSEDGQKLLLVGIMTAKKYLNSRVIAAYDTWAREIPGRVIIFFQ